MAVNSKYYLSDKMVDYITGGANPTWGSYGSCVINPQICQAILSKYNYRMTAQTYVSDDRIPRTAEQIREEMGLERNE